MDFVHGMGKWEEPAWACCLCREKAVGLRPTTRWGRKAPDPFSWYIARQTGHNLGSYQNFQESMVFDWNHAAHRIVSTADIGAVRRMVLALLWLPTIGWWVLLG